MPPKWEPVPVPVPAGPSDKICRTVSFVERYRGNQQTVLSVVFADFSRNASQEHYGFFTAPVVLIVRKQAPCFEINTNSERNMTMNIRRLTASLLAAVTLLALTACGGSAKTDPGTSDQPSASDENWTPKENVTMIVAYKAGSGTDNTARVLSQYATKYVGKTIVIENQEGGSGSIGWTALANAKPDGYTLGFVNLPTLCSNIVD